MKNWRGEIYGAQLFFRLSAILLSAVFCPLLFGVWFDQTAKTAPFATLCLTIAGVIVGTVAIYRIIFATYKQIGGRPG
ncbi:MAG: AtpZ/AtpI family protein [Chloroflexi bacterium]|nr:AtpZ/AtpI family protein [Chloroflexota bacterium]